MKEAHKKLYKTIKFKSRYAFSIGELCFSSSLSRPISAESQINSATQSIPTEITSKFISIFTKQPFSEKNPELTSLAPNLNNKVVESVLSNFKSWKLAYVFFTWASKQHGYKHNMYTYNAMASILSHARQNAPLRVLANEVLDSRCYMSPGALGFFMRCLGSVGLIEEANLWFDEVKILGLCVPNSYSYNCLIEANSKNGKIDLVEQRLKEMKDSGLGYDKYTLTPVLMVYCNKGMFQKAFSVFNEIYDHGWADEHVLSVLALAFCKWGEVDKACELVSRSEDGNIRILNEKTFYVLIHGFVRASRLDKALELFDKMKVPGFIPDISVYDVLIGGLCTTGEFEEALKLYSEMKGVGVKPDIGIVSKLISSSPSEGELTRFLTESHEDVEMLPLTLVCNSLIKIFVNDGLIDKAYSLLQSMIKGESIGNIVEIKPLDSNKTVSPDTTSFSIVINSLLKDGKVDLALTLFRDMVRIGCKRNVALYNNLIDGLCSSNRLEESYELLREMEELGLKPTHFTHNSIFGCLCKRGDVVGALDMVKKMRAHGHEPWIKYSTLLAKELCKKGKTVEAYKFLFGIVEEGFPPDIISYSGAMSGLIEIQEVDLALDLFRDVCARGYSPDVVAYNVLIKGLCQAQRVAEARDLLKEMIMKGLVPSVVTYNLLMDGWCKSGDVDQAMLCFSRMFGHKREPNVFTYTTLIDGLCNTGRPDKALTLWEEMKGKGCTPNEVAFMALVNGLCKCGRPEEALVHFHTMKEKELKPETFIYMVLMSAFLSEGNSQLAFEIFKEMVVDGKLPDPTDKNYSLLKDAISKMLEDERIAVNIKNLITENNLIKILIRSLGRSSSSVD